MVLRHRPELHFTYKGRAVDVKQVGRELGVRYVLRVDQKSGVAGSNYRPANRGERPGISLGGSVRRWVSRTSSTFKTHH